MAVVGAVADHARQLEPGRDLLLVEASPDGEAPRATALLRITRLVMSSPLRPVSSDLEPLSAPVRVPDGQAPT